MFVKKDRRYIYPNPFLRLSAFLLDSFLIVAPFALLWGVIFGYREMKTDNPSIYLTAVELAAFWLITSYMISKTGQTPGKKALGLYVIHSETFEKISFARASFRFLLWTISWLTLGAAFFMAFLSPKKQTLSDKFSKTLVVRDIGAKNTDA